MVTARRPHGVRRPGTPVAMHIGRARDVPFRLDLAMGSFSSGSGDRSGLPLTPQTRHHSSSDSWRQSSGIGYEYDGYESVFRLTLKPAGG